MKLTKEQIQFIKDNNDMLIELVKARIAEIKDMAADIRYSLEQRDLFAHMANEYENFWLYNLNNLRETYAPLKEKDMKQKIKKFLHERV